MCCIVQRYVHQNSSLMLYSEKRSLCVIYYIYSSPIGYTQVILRLISLRLVEMLHKMASNVGIWAKSLCIFIVAMVTFVFQIKNNTHVRKESVTSVVVLSVFLYFRYHIIVFFFLFHPCALFILGVYGFLIKQATSLLSSMRNANGHWGWAFMAKREQMLSEMLRWFSHQTAHPPCPPAV